MSATAFTIFVPEIEAFGGAERSVVALSRWLHERGLKHRFLHYYDAIDLTRHAGHPIDRVVLAPARNPRAKIAALKGWFKRMPNDAPRPLMSGIQAATHASIAGIDGFHTLMHDTPSLLSGSSVSLKSRIRRFISDRALTRGLNSGGVTMVTSAYLRAETERLWHPPVTVVRMGGIEGRTFRPRTVGTQLCMLSVCRVEANKRIDWMIRSLAALESRTPSLSQRIDWRLDIVGGGSQIGPLKALTEALGLDTRVAFSGFVPDEQLAAYYDRAALFLMPARQGYGIPAAEALARGIPVLLHRESGISDLLVETPWAVVMEGDESAMPAALDRSITALIEGRHVDAPHPRIPTEAEWAEQVARCCGWYNPDEAAAL